MYITQEEIWALNAAFNHLATRVEGKKYANSIFESLIARLNDSEPKLRELISNLIKEVKEKGSAQTSTDQFLSAFSGERSEVDVFLNKALEWCKEAGLQLTKLHDHPAVGPVYSVKLA